jgi:4-amino-4-deoxy-L-arabinose transferase-like glycosyltransferase
MDIRLPLSSVKESAGTINASLSALLRRPGAGSVIIILLWACLSLPNLSVRSFIWEEGTNAEIARDVLAHGHLLEPYIYGVRFVDKPSLLPWLIAGVASLTGTVNEWSARLPSMISILLTALLVQRLTQRYASLSGSLFAAFSFLLCPLVLQKLSISEPDTVLTFFSFAAFVLWWNGASSARISISRWSGCGLLLALLALAKGPQPAGFFGLGVLAYLVTERRWRDLPGFFFCMSFPIITSVAWVLAVYHPGDGAVWHGYTRTGGLPGLRNYLEFNLRKFGEATLELMPGLILLPIIPWPWRRDRAALTIDGVAKPLILYSLVCTVALFLWPGAQGRYAMPIAPSLAVLEGFAWDILNASKKLALQRILVAAFGTLASYQFALVTLIMPIYAERFGESRLVGMAIDQAIRSAPAPGYCTDLSTNQLFYVHEHIQCIELSKLASIAPPAWLLIDPLTLARYSALKPDQKLRVVVETNSGPQLAAVRLE